MPPPSSRGHFHSNTIPSTSRNPIGGLPDVQPAPQFTEPQSDHEFQDLIIETRPQDKVPFTPPHLIPTFPHPFSTPQPRHLQLHFKLPTIEINLQFFHSCSTHFHHLPIHPLVSNNCPHSCIAALLLARMLP